MLGMEVPQNKNAAHATFQKNLEFFVNLEKSQKTPAAARFPENLENCQISQSLSNYVWDGSSQQIRSKCKIPKKPRESSKFKKIPKSQQLCLG